MTPHGGMGVVIMHLFAESLRGTCLLPADVLGNRSLTHGAHPVVELSLQSSVIHCGPHVSATLPAREALQETALPGAQPKQAAVSWHLWTPSALGLQGGVAVQS